MVVPAIRVRGIAMHILQLCAMCLLVASSVRCQAPQPPQGLAAVAGGAGVELTWNAVAGAGGYNVYRDDEYFATTESASHTDPDGTAGDVYYVTAFDTSRSVFSDQSKPATARAAGNRPPAPTGLAAVADESGVELTWNAVAGAGGYNVYRDDEYFATTERASHTDADGTAGDEYYVTAFDASKSLFSERSAFVAAAAADGDPPASSAPVQLNPETADGPPEAATATPTLLLEYDFDYEVVDQEEEEDDAGGGGESGDGQRGGRGGGG